MNDTPNLHIDYTKIIHDHMLIAVQSILRQVEQHGLSGDHHYYIQFQTDHPKVQISPRLAEEYPQEITIVLQHQFWDLCVDNGGFSVRLGFGARFENLYVPWTALLGFSDPFAQFSLQFQPDRSDTAQGLRVMNSDDETKDEAPITELKAKKSAPQKSDNKKTPPPAQQAAERANGLAADNVVTLDKFRATKE